MTEIYYFIVIVFGLAIGSFLNALVWRVREKKTILLARSVCPQCAAVIAWHDNIPVVSFFFLVGKCRSCSKSISPQYPFIELITAALFVYAFYVSANHYDVLDPLSFFHMIVIPFAVLALLVFIALYDAKYKEIHTITTIYPALAFFMYTGISGMQTWISMLVGAGVVSGFFLLQYVISKGRWIGGGDVRYGVLMGVLLGWPHALVGLLFAYCLGAIVGIVQLLLKQKTLKSETAFGTYLVVGTIIALFWGEQALSWYIALL